MKWNGWRSPSSWPASPHSSASDSSTFSRLVYLSDARPELRGLALSQDREQNLAVPHAHPRPHRIRLHDTGLATTVVRVVGYRGECACGWTGQNRKRWDDARRDASEHNEAERRGETA